MMNQLLLALQSSLDSFPAFAPMSHYSTGHKVVNMAELFQSDFGAGEKYLCECFDAVAGVLQTEPSLDDDDVEQGIAGGMSEIRFNTQFVES